MPSLITNLVQKPKKRTIAIILALIGTVTPIVGLHKFYLGQPLWGILYLIISWQNPMARIACAIDIVLYLAKNQEQFNQRFNGELVIANEQNTVPGKQIKEIASALRELEQLRQEGLISEYEFEQKRRQLLS
jgi:TM2 domain-containing membrane protein YozV